MGKKLTPNIMVKFCNKSKFAGKICRGNLRGKFAGKICGENLRGKFAGKICGETFAGNIYGENLWGICTLMGKNINENLW